MSQSFQHPNFRVLASTSGVLNYSTPLLRAKEHTLLSNTLRCCSLTLQCSLFSRQLLALSCTVFPLCFLYCLGIGLNTWNAGSSLTFHLQLIMDATLSGRPLMSTQLKFPVPQIHLHISFFSIFYPSFSADRN